MVQRTNVLSQATRDDDALLEPVLGERYVDSEVTHMQRQTATLQKTQLTGESVDAYLPNLYLAFRHTNSQHSTLDGWQRTTRNKTNPKSSCAGATNVYKFRKEFNFDKKMFARRH